MVWHFERVVALLLRKYGFSMYHKPQLIETKRYPSFPLVASNTFAVQISKCEKIIVSDCQQPS